MGVFRDLDLSLERYGVFPNIWLGFRYSVPTIELNPGLTLLYLEDACEMVRLQLYGLYREPTGKSCLCRPFLTCVDDCEGFIASSVLCQEK